MRELVFFLEEQSAKEMLEGVLPRLLDENTNFRCIFFQGKQDMEKQLGRKLRNWHNPDSHFIVVRDQDSADCVAVKQRLTEICNEAGKPGALVRIVCHELESWYLGDLHAVELGLGIKGLVSKQKKRNFRAPDQLPNPKQVLKLLTKNQYQPILGSREIGRHLSLEDNRSTSFNVFLAGVNRLLEQETC